MTHSIFCFGPYFGGLKSVNRGLHKFQVCLNKFLAYSSPTHHFIKHLFKGHCQSFLTRCIQPNENCLCWVLKCIVHCFDKLDLLILVTLIRLVCGWLRFSTTIGFFSPLTTSPRPTPWTFETWLMNVEHLLLTEPAPKGRQTEADKTTPPKSLWTFHSTWPQGELFWLADSFAVLFRECLALKGNAKARLAASFLCFKPPNLSWFAMTLNKSAGYHRVYFSKVRIVLNSTPKKPPSFASTRWLRAAFALFQPVSASSRVVTYPWPHPDPEIGSSYNWRTLLRTGCATQTVMATPLQGYNRIASTCATKRLM